MSSSGPPFGPQHIIGIVRLTGRPLPSPQFQDVWPIRTATGHLNGLFISKCYQHLFDEDAERLRTILRSVLASQWWRDNSYRDAPIAALDVFVLPPTTGGSGNYVCQFCNGTYASAGAALGCVRGHIDV
ncbi:hypothetical protein FRC19_002375 [Serendipita sp. 401]|nr:hypothetical protein FRC19_002375 [Serendipita sp. 401]KAG9046148.1 hypothetical protein FS842_000989 [Serendipita sp. 407]